MTRMSDENETQGTNEGAGVDQIREFLEANEVTTNDAVAGETVEPGRGDGNEGPTGGSPREFEPELHEHDEQQDQNDAPQDLDDGSSGAGGGL
jgi:hypothetical protein